MIQLSDLTDVGLGGHTVYLADRGGMRQIDQLLDVGLVRWTRVRDDISEATIMITATNASAQADLLQMIEPFRHEIVIYRGHERVWEGPIMRLSDTKSGVEIYAHDPLYYLNRTTMRAGYSSAYPNVEPTTARLERIIRAELARWEAISPPVNILPHLTRHARAGEAETAKVTKPYEMQLFEHLDEMAQRAGLDYTCVGRAIHLWDTSGSLGQTPVTTENDYIGDLVVTYYGAELATISNVTDGQGAVGTAFAPQEQLDYYGPVEVLASAFGEEEEGEVVDPAVLASQAKMNLGGRYPVPLQVRVPDNSSINMAGVIKMNMLVPGVYVPLRATLSIRTISQMQKLHSVKVEETADGETVQVVLTPATAPDPIDEEE